MGGRKDETARIRAVRPLCIMTATGHVPAAPVQHSVFIVGKEFFVKKRQNKLQRHEVNQRGV